MSVQARRTVIVTGASRGLGRVIALRFGSLRNRVAVVYREQNSAAEEVVQEIAGAGGEAFSIRADVRVPHDCNAMVSAVLMRWERLDVLVNNAAVIEDRLCIRMSEQEWDDVMDTTLSGVFHCIRSAAGVLREQRSGHIVNISSIVGLQGREGQSNYASAKAGIIGLTKAAARELGPFNVKVNAVLPGFLLTDMGDSVSPEMRDRIYRESVLHRGSSPDEVAGFIAHLTSMQNVSGQVFNIDSRII